MDKELLFMDGASLAFVAALLTIVDRILSLKERLRGAKGHRPYVKLHEEPHAGWPAEPRSVPLEGKQISEWALLKNSLNSALSESCVAPHEAEARGRFPTA